MKLKYTCGGDSCNVSESEDSTTFFYPCINHSICTPYKVHLTPGVYTIECYGARGGPVPEVPGGLGGISKGTIIIYNSINVYVSVGAEGEMYGTESIYGGGGRGNCRNDGGIKGGGSGGGSTDVRIKENDFNSRILVAGGGAGSERYNIPLPGGNAGGLVGSDGISFGHAAVISPGKGGSQTSGGSSGNSGKAGSFYYGGSANHNHGSGGGGGYYGGGAGSVDDGTVSSGGGGSSFIAGYRGCTVNPSFSRFIFFKAEMLTNNTEESKVIITKNLDLSIKTYGCKQFFIEPFIFILIFK